MSEVRLAGVDNTCRVQSPRTVTVRHFYTFPIQQGVSISLTDYIFLDFAYDLKQNLFLVFYSKPLTIIFDLLIHLYTKNGSWEFYKALCSQLKKISYNLKSFMEIQQFFLIREHSKYSDSNITNLEGALKNVFIYILSDFHFNFKDTLITKSNIT